MSKKIEKFEDLLAWQKARELTREVYRSTREEAFTRDYGLCSQIQRAAVSIMSNIAEGFERGNPREFHQYLSIAKSSCAEVRSQLYIALDNGYLNEQRFNELMTLGIQTGCIIGGLRVSVERRRDVK
jgi:four helix bundle protein